MDFEVISPGIEPSQIVPNDHCGPIPIDRLCNCIKRDCSVGNINCPSSEDVYAQ